KYIEFIRRVFVDFYFQNLLKNYSWNTEILKFKSSDSPLAKNLAEKGKESLIEEILKFWVEGKQKICFEPDPTSRKSLKSYQGDIIFKTIGIKDYTCHIRLSFD
ncbi:unnamed protein product, partial [marine sediment metagenome]